MKAVLILLVSRSISQEPEICNVCQYHKIFTPERADELWDRCRNRQSAVLKAKES